MIRNLPPKIEKLEPTDESEIGEAEQRRQQFDKNNACPQANVSEVYSVNRGQHICVAGQECRPPCLCNFVGSV